jgi:hypothetical protein
MQRLSLRALCGLPTTPFAIAAADVAAGVTELVPDERAIIPISAAQYLVWTKAILAKDDFQWGAAT